MNFSYLKAMSVLLTLVATSLSAQEKHVEQTRPFLRLDADGPISFGRALAFDSSGTLYAGGWDQLVRAWSPAGGRFMRDPGKTIRVPIGPGLNGAINAIATSPDGRWIAVAGVGVAEGSGAEFRTNGRIVPSSGGSMSEAMRLDQGTIYVVDAHTRKVRSLRGHRGEVLALQFVPGNDPWLVSAGIAHYPLSQEGKAVVRLWNVETHESLYGTYLDVQSDRVVDPPQLAIRRTGSGTNELQVAIAWNDGQLRQWDLSAGNVVTTRDGDPKNKTVVFSEDVGLITGSYSSTAFGGGSLTTWPNLGRLDGGTSAALQRGQQIHIAPSHGRFGLPQALGLLTHGDAPYAVVAVQAIDVKQRQAIPTHLELQLVDLRTQQSVFRHQLWSTGAAMVDVPAVCVSPDGQFVAVTGGAPDHGIYIFETSAMLENRGEPQVLRSSSARPISAWFTKQDTQQGLAIRQLVDGEDPRDLVLDFSAGSLSEISPAWKNDVAPQTDWRVDVISFGESEDYQLGLKLTAADGSKQIVKLPKGQEAINAVTMVPPSTHVSVPLVAVASHQKGQPMLSLYNASNGDQLRQFTGHTEPIDSLSIGREGRFLVSTANDRTVRIWSLLDIDPVLLGQRGMLSGVRVKQGPNASLLVDEVSADSPASGKLQPNDELAGFLAWGIARAWSDPAEFYQTWWGTKPGTSLSVDVRRKGQLQRVELVASQGIDERKPLFSLFLARQDVGMQPHWIGWSPLGLFESSDREVERFLGWHFNTGNPENPTLFADLGQYRDDFYHPGLLDYLIKHGEPPASEPVQPVAPPDLSLSVFQNDQLAHLSQWDALVRTNNNLSLVLTVDAAYPSTLIADVDCLVDGQPAGRMTPTDSGLQWKINLASDSWPRGKHELTAIVRTNEPEPREFPATLQVRYQPLPPKLEITSQTEESIQDKKFLFEAKVTTPEDAFVELFERGPEGRKKVHSWPVAKGEEVISKELELDVGRHAFDVIARNVQALDSFESQETTGQSLIVQRALEMSKAPRVIVRRSEVGRPDLEIEPGQVVHVNAPRLAIRSTIQSDQEIDGVHVHLEVEQQARETQSVSDLQREHENVQFHHLLQRIRPGRTRVWVEANTVAGTAADSYFEIEYQPPVPTIKITEPAISKDAWFDRAEERVLPLQAVLLLPDDRQTREDVLDNVRVTVAVNGQPIAVQPEVDGQTGIVRATLPVEIGENLIELQLNAGDEIRVRESLVVSCYEALEGAVDLPEKINQVFRLLELPDDVEPTRVENAATGESIPWVRDSGGLELMTNEVNSEEFVARVHFPRLPTVDFKIAAPEVPQSLVPPVIRFVTPVNDDQVQSPMGSVEFSIASESRLTRVEVQHTSKQGRRQTTVDVEPQINAGETSFTLQHEITTPLDLGLNTFTVFAVNESGSTSEPIHVTRIQSPVTLHLEKIEPRQGEPIYNAVEFGTPSFAGPSDDAVATLHGYLELNDGATEKWRTGRHYLHTWVNGFQQLPSRLTLEQTKGQTRLRFKTPILLSSPVNQLELEVPGLPRESRQQVFDVECAQPLRDQRLHLLVIGATPRAESTELLEGALQTLQLNRFGIDQAELSERMVTRYDTRPDESGRRHVFREVYLYRPLTGVSVNNRMISGHLGLVHRTIVDLNSRRPSSHHANDVVVVYYAGSEQVRNDGHFHLTTASKDQLLSSDVLARFVHNSLGAHLLLLDVNRSALAGGPLPMTEGISVLRLAKPESHTMMTRLLADANPLPSSLRDFDTELRQSVQAVPGFPRTIQYDGMVSESMVNLRLTPD